jgi:hypothetical protein
LFWVVGWVVAIIDLIFTLAKQPPDRCNGYIKPNTGEIRSKLGLNTKPGKLMTVLSNKIM